MSKYKHLSPSLSPLVKRRRCRLLCWQQCFFFCCRSCYFSPSACSLSLCVRGTMLRKCKWSMLVQRGVFNFLIVR